MTKVETQNSPSFANCSFFHVYKSIINGFAAKLTTKGLEEVSIIFHVAILSKPIDATAVDGSMTLFAKGVEVVIHLFFIFFYFLNFFSSVLVSLFYLFV